MSYTFAEAGTKYVRLTLTDSVGRSSSVEHNVGVTASGTTTPPPTETTPPPTEPTPPPPPPAPRPACNKTISSSSAVASALSSASAGSAVCLSAGSYSRLALESINPAGNVTLEPAEGAAVRSPAST